MKSTKSLSDPKLFGPWFRDIETWLAWFAYLSTMYALPMNREQRRIYDSCTRRSKLPTKPFREAYLVVGRRGGKSFIAALIAVHHACFTGYRPYLSPGEVGTVMIIASNRKQARVIMRYVKALLNEVQLLRQLIVRQTAESIELSNRVNIEIHTSGFRAVRGYTIVAAVLDELAFWRSEESQNPDFEIIAALRPAMATIPTSMLLCISSPYARRGALYEAHRDYFGKDDDNVLVWQADTRTMNPTVPQKVIDDAYQRDPQSASAEYGAQFRSDVSGFLLEAWIASACVEDVYQLPYCDQFKYFAFADPSGGAKDSFTLSIAHRDDDQLILDLIVGKKPPFNPAGVVEEFCNILGQYNICKVTGDRYAGQWVVDAFKQHDVEYTHSDKSKSEIFLECEPHFAQGTIQLLNHKRLLSELRQLERKTGASGRDRIDHPPSGHDDYANAACGALWLCSNTHDALKSEDALAALNETLNLTRPSYFKPNHRS